MFGDQPLFVLNLVLSIMFPFLTHLVNTLGYILFLVKKVIKAVQSDWVVNIVLSINCFNLLAFLIVSPVHIPTNKMVLLRAHIAIL